MRKIQLSAIIGTKIIIIILNKRERGNFEGFR